MASSAIAVVSDGTKKTTVETPAVNDEKLVVVGNEGGEAKNADEKVTSKTVDVAANDEKLLVVCDDGGAAKSATAADVATAAESQKVTLKKKNRIHVSNSKRPFLFYCNLAKRYIKQYNAVELSALGMAIPTLITIAETLKNNGLAVEKKISTSTVVSKPEGEEGRVVRKAQIAILLGKAEKLEEETPVAVVAAA